MPEIVTHYYFGQQVLQDLQDDTKSWIIPELYEIGVRGPDPLGIVHFRNPPVWKRVHGKSNWMHTKGCGKLFRNLADIARKAEIREQALLFSYLSGFLTHYCLDSVCHPYVIYRAGAGKECLGNHRSLEHAIDRNRLRQHRMKLSDRPITNRILPNPGLLPAEIRKAIDWAYRDAFDWDDTWGIINQALRDERAFIRMTEDPRGHFYSFVSKLTNNGNLLSLCYSEPSYQGIDTENEHKREWKNPYDPSMVFNQSFAELEKHAAALSMEMIEGICSYIFHDAQYPILIGNRSFESGLDADDERNQAEPVCSVLQGRSAM